MRSVFQPTGLGRASQNPFGSVDWCNKNVKRLRLVHLIPIHVLLLPLWCAIMMQTAYNVYETKLARASVPAHARAAQRDRVVVMVVQLGEFNTFDQRHIEFALWKARHLEMVRLTLSEIAVGGHLNEHGLLHITLPCGRVVEAAVVYFRAGYTPLDYPSKTEWAARLLLERSAALKCPNTAWHLVGTKKMQQVWF